MYINSSLSALTHTLLSGSAAVRGAKAQLALGGTATISAASANAVYPTATRTLSADATAFMADYRTNLHQLKSAAESVLKPTAAQTQAGSSNAAVAEVTGHLQQPRDSYILEVSQIALDQINRTEALPADGALPTLGGTLELQTEAGRYNLSLSAGGFSSNREMLWAYADKITALGAGVTASVIEREGMAHLEVSGQGAFSLSGSFARRTGLDTASQLGQEAIFALTKNGTERDSFTSSSNTVEVDGLTVQLTGPGSATLAAEKNPTRQTAERLDRLISRFNDTLSFLSKNEDKGIGVLRQTRRMLSSLGSERTLAQIGLSVGGDGSLSIDSHRFSEAMSRDAGFVTGILNRVAEGISRDAAAGLSESAYNLINGTLDKTQNKADAALRQTGYDLDTVRFMSTYNRNGVYNAMNMMVVGALMNISA